jgi:hypothetical protein
MAILGFVPLGFDPTYIVLVFIPMLILMGAAQLVVRSAYARYSRVPNRQGITGAEAATLILRNAGIDDVRVEPHRGWLSDHYSPTEKVVRLSPENYSGSSIAAVGIAAHEVGHAIQHAHRYAPLVVRNAAVPLASVGSRLGYVLVILGMIVGGAVAGSPLNWLSLAGLLLVAAVVVFQVINLPVEFDASRRALEVLPRSGVLTADETRGARNVLAAAALTYVAATIAAILELLYLAWRLGLLGGNRRD